MKKNYLMIIDWALVKREKNNRKNTANEAKNKRSNFALLYLYLLSKLRNNAERKKRINNNVILKAIVYVREKNISLINFPQIRCFSP